MEYADLFKMAKSMGMTNQSADEMANEHIVRREKKVPAYVRAHMNAAINGKISSTKVIQYLNKAFGYNVENVHRVAGFTVNRNGFGDWYIC